MWVNKQKVMFLYIADINRVLCYLQSWKNTKIVRIVLNHF